MTCTTNRLAALLLPLLAAAVLPARAESSASSLVSESASSASIGASSASIGHSSDSSSRQREVAEGRYRVIEVADAPARPGHVRLKLQPEDTAAAGSDTFYLTLPREAADLGRIEPGQVVTAQPRAYGVAFADARTLREFFLVLADDWMRELKTRVVRL